MGLKRLLLFQLQCGSSANMSSQYRKLNYPAADRNKDPILSVLQSVLPSDRPLLALEVASGTGQHLAYFSQHLKNVEWRPSEMTSQLLDSIRGHRVDQLGSNMLEPWRVDVSTPPDDWPDLAGCQQMAQFDVMLNVNMVHIAPWQVAQGLFCAAGRLLKPSGLLIMYGPFSKNGVLTPESNRSFDRSLRERDPSWGIRDISHLEEEARGALLGLETIHEMPANNKILVWRKNGQS